MLNDALFTVDYSEMVIVKDIDFYCLCEHHLLPFFGKCHVAYIPRERVIGLSKIPRLVDVFARRLQIQERMTNQIAETIREKINPLGVAVVCEGTHLCMSMRGVEKQNSFAITSAMLGAFRENARTRMEFLELLKIPVPQVSAVPMPRPGLRERLRCRAAGRRSRRRCLGMAGRGWRCLQRPRPRRGRPRGRAARRARRRRRHRPRSSPRRSRVPNPLGDGVQIEEEFLRRADRPRRRPTESSSRFRPTRAPRR